MMDKKLKEKLLKEKESMSSEDLQRVLNSEYIPESHKRVLRGPVSKERVAEMKYWDDLQKFDPMYFPHTGQGTTLYSSGKDVLDEFDIDSNMGVISTKSGNNIIYSTNGLDKSTKFKDDLERKNVVNYLSRERPYVPLSPEITKGSQRGLILNNLAKKLGHSGLKALPWLGLATSLSSGDVMGSVPVVGDILSSEDVGQGSDEIPYEQRYTPKPIIPSWLGIKN